MACHNETLTKSPPELSVDYYTNDGMHALLKRIELEIKLNTTYHLMDHQFELVCKHSLTFQQLGHRFFHAQSTTKQWKKGTYLALKELCNQLIILKGKNGILMSCKQSN